jgi:hypothetical protein
MLWVMVFFVEKHLVVDGDFAWERSITCFLLMPLRLVIVDDGLV